MARMPPVVSIPETSAVERSIRRILLAIFVLGVTGLAADLLLLDHVEDWTQWIPLALFALALTMLAAHFALRRAATVRAFQIIIGMFIIAGGLGAFLHYRGNMEFQTDIDPSIGGLELFMKVMRAKVPPALAPLAMIQLGLLGFAWSYRHPLTRRARV